LDIAIAVAVRIFWTWVSLKLKLMGISTPFKNNLHDVEKLLRGHFLMGKIKQLKNK
jgi:hypothetical protein